MPTFERCLLTEHCSLALRILDLFLLWSLTFSVHKTEKRLAVHYSFLLYSLGLVERHTVKSRGSGTRRSTSRMKGCPAAIISSCSMTVKNFLRYQELRLLKLRLRGRFEGRAKSTNQARDDNRLKEGRNVQDSLFMKTPTTRSKISTTAPNSMKGRYDYYGKPAASKCFHP